MPTVNINQENFESTVEKENITLVDCWAAWCGACKDFDPIYQRIAERHTKHTFGKIDTQTEKTLVKKLGIEHIPSLLIFREGILLFRQPGYYTEEQLEDIVQQAESLDMNEVRAYMESESQEEKTAE